MIDYQHLPKPTRLRIYTPAEMISGSIWSHTHKPLWFDFHVGRGKRKILYTKITDQTGLVRSLIDAESWLCLKVRQLPCSCAALHEYLDAPRTQEDHAELLMYFMRHVNRRINEIGY